MNATILILRLFVLFVDLIGDKRAKALFSNARGVFISENAEFSIIPHVQYFCQEKYCTKNRQFSPEIYT